MKKSICLLLMLWIAAAFLQDARLTAQKVTRDNANYKVVINHEEQYSILPLSERSKSGWKDTKITGDLAKCMKYIEEVWTDMRPLSIRKMKLSDETTYSVIINHEEQYAIWPEGRPLPKSWTRTSVAGSLPKCTAYIEEVWTDMRPLSIRKKMK